MFELKIKTDNAAFDGDDIGPEVSRILRCLATRIETEPFREDEYLLHDSNGNKIGKAILTRDD